MKFSHLVSSSVTVVCAVMLLRCGTSKRDGGFEVVVPVVPK